LYELQTAGVLNEFDQELMFFDLSAFCCQSYLLISFIEFLTNIIKILTTQILNLERLFLLLKD